MARTDIDKLINKALTEAQAQGRDLDALTTVTVDGPEDRVVCWVTPAPPGTRARVDHHDARAGDVITIPVRDAIRLSVLGFIKEANDAIRHRQQAQAASEAAGYDQAKFDAAVEAAVEARLAAKAQADAAYAAATSSVVPSPVATGDASEEPAPVPDLSALTGAPPADVPTEDPPPVRESGLADAELPTGAAELTAHLTQFPDDADRIRDIELAKPAKDRRTTVLAATGMTADEVAAAQAS